MPSYQSKHHGIIGADAPYIYIGGWSDFRGPDDSAIDFGLQYSPARHEWDEASQFSRYNPNHNPSIQPRIFRSLLHLKPGAVVTLSICVFPFSVGQATSNQATTTLLLAIDTPGARVYSTFATVSSNANWNTAGQNQYFKRMVSIAQAPQPYGVVDEYIGEGYWHQTWIKNVMFGEGPDSTWVYRAARDYLGRVQVPSGTAWPSYTLPPWINGANGTNVNNPLQGIWFHPNPGQVDRQVWLKDSVIAAAYPFGYFRNELDFCVGIDCRGNAKLF